MAVMNDVGAIAFVGSGVEERTGSWERPVEKIQRRQWEVRVPWPQPLRFPWRYQPSSSMCIYTYMHCTHIYIYTYIHAVLLWAERPPLWGLRNSAARWCSQAEGPVYDQPKAVMRILAVSRLALFPLGCLFAQGSRYRAILEFSAP